MDDLLREFLAEASESLDVVDAKLVRLEREPGNVTILDNIFRLVHSIKGTCGFLGLPRFEALVHATETLLEKLRDGAPARQETLELIHAAVERMKATLVAIEGGNAETAGQQHLQPIGHAWKRLPRLVRDLARHLGKSIELEMHGADIGLDRAVINLIKDPVMHIARNAADHGIETPQARAAAGKPETGKIRLSAWLEGKHAVIEIADDGRGFDTAGLKREIVRSGLSSEAEAEIMSRQQIQNFAFAPGLTTVAAVTRISGRGIGMDVVRHNIMQLGGGIDLKSVEGEGTVITLKIPLTPEQVHNRTPEFEKLSFVVFRTGEGQQKAVPQPLVTKIEKIDAAKIIRTKNGEVVGYHGRLMPLVRAGTAAVQLHGSQSILVFSDAGRLTGLAVDDIAGIAENETAVEIKSGKPGVIGTALIKGRVTEVIDIGTYLPCDLKLAQV